MEIKQRDFITITRKLEMRVREGRDTLAFFFYNGQKTGIFTRVSHTRGSLKGRITSFIRQQLHLNEDQFRDLINCPLDKEGYVRILKDTGII